MHSTGNLAWFALQVRPRIEGNIARLLQDRGLEQFLPLYHCRRQWKHRTATSDIPLFPGYIFCRFDPNRRLGVLTTPGVLRILGTGRAPVPVPDDEIAVIRRIIDSDPHVEPHPYVKYGQRVRIISGPLSGAEGIMVSAKKGRRFTVSVNLLQRSVAAEMSPNCEFVVIRDDRPSLQVGQINANWIS